MGIQKKSRLLLKGSSLSPAVDLHFDREEEFAENEKEPRVVGSFDSYAKNQPLIDVLYRIQLRHQQIHQDAGAQGHKGQHQACAGFFMPLLKWAVFRQT